MSGKRAVVSEIADCTRQYREQLGHRPVEAERILVRHRPSGGALAKVLPPLPPPSPPIDKDTLHVIVKERLRQAGRTLRRLKKPTELAQLAAELPKWPTVIHDASEHAAYVPRRPRVAVPARDIDALDECLGWLLWLKGDERTIVFAWMLGYGFRQIAALDPSGRKKSRIAQIFEKAIGHIMVMLV